MQIFLTLSLSYSQQLLYENAKHRNFSIDRIIGRYEFLENTEICKNFTMVFAKPMYK